MNDLNLKLDDFIINTNNRLNKNEIESAIKDVSELKSPSEKIITIKETYADNQNKEKS
jgi:hypothetical protein